MRYAREHLSWDRKAQIVSKILYWTVGQGLKPDLPPPKRYAHKIVAGPLTSSSYGSMRWSQKNGLDTCTLSSGKRSDFPRPTSNF